MKKPCFTNKTFYWLLVACALIGLYAAVTLTVDKYRLLHNPNASLDCNLNPIISCGSVMKTPEAVVFGFPNSILGIPAFLAVLVIGLLALSGRTLGRRVWLGLLASAFLANLFTHWLFYQSVYRIHNLCPYCMAVWIVSMLIFLYTLLFIVNHNYLQNVPSNASNFLRNHHFDLYLAWLILLTGLILHHFWYYFKTVL